MAPPTNHTCARFLPPQVRELIYREILEYHPQVRHFPLQTIDNSCCRCMLWTLTVRPGWPCPARLLGRGRYPLLPLTFIAPTACPVADACRLPCGRPPATQFRLPLGRWVHLCRAQSMATCCSMVLEALALRAASCFQRGCKHLVVIPATDQTQPALLRLCSGQLQAPVCTPGGGRARAGQPQPGPGAQPPARLGTRQALAGQDRLHCSCRHDSLLPSLRPEACLRHVCSRRHVSVVCRPPHCRGSA